MKKCCRVDFISPTILYLVLFALFLIFVFIHAVALFPFDNIPEYSRMHSSLLFPMPLTRLFVFFSFYIKLSLALLLNLNSLCAFLFVCFLLFVQIIVTEAILMCERIRCAHTKQFTVTTVEKDIMVPKHSSIKHYYPLLYSSILPMQWQ